MKKFINDKDIIHSHLAEAHSAHSIFVDSSCRNLLNYLRLCFTQNEEKNNYIFLIRAEITEPNHLKTLEHLSNFKKDNFTKLGYFNENGERETDDSYTLAEMINLVCAVVLLHNHTPTDRMARLATFKSCLLELEKQTSIQSTFCSAGIRGLFICPIAAYFTPCKLQYISSQLTLVQRNAIVASGVVILFKQEEQFIFAFLNRQRNYQEKKFSSPALLNLVSNCGIQDGCEITSIPILKLIDKFLRIPEHASYQPLLGIPIIENFNAWALSKIKSFYAADLEKKSPIERYRILFLWLESSYSTLALDECLHQYFQVSQFKIMNDLSDELKALNIWGTSAEAIIRNTIYFDDATLPPIPTEHPLIAQIHAFMQQNIELVQKNHPKPPQDEIFFLLAKANHKITTILKTPNQTLESLSAHNIGGLLRIYTGIFQISKHIQDIRDFRDKDLLDIYLRLSTKLLDFINSPNFNFPLLNHTEEHSLSSLSTYISQFLVINHHDFLTNFFVIWKNASRAQQKKMYALAKEIYSTHIFIKEDELFGTSGENNSVILSPKVVSRFFLHAFLTPVNQWSIDFHKFFISLIEGVEQNFNAEQENFREAMLSILSSETYSGQFLNKAKLLVEMFNKLTAIPNVENIDSTIPLLSSMYILGLNSDLLGRAHCKLGLSLLLNYLKTCSSERILGFLSLEILIIDDSSSSLILPNTFVPIFTILLGATSLGAQDDALHLEVIQMLYDNISAAELSPLLVESLVSMYTPSESLSNLNQLVVNFYIKIVTHIPKKPYIWEDELKILFYEVLRNNQAAAEALILGLRYLNFFNPATNFALQKEDNTEDIFLQKLLLSLTRPDLLGHAITEMKLQIILIILSDWHFSFHAKSELEKINFESIPKLGVPLWQSLTIIMNYLRDKKFKYTTLEHFNEQTFATEFEAFSNYFLSQNDPFLKIKVFYFIKFVRNLCSPFLKQYFDDNKDMFLSDHSTLTWQEKYACFLQSLSDMRREKLLYDLLKIKELSTDQLKFQQCHESYLELKGSFENALREINQTPWTRELPIENIYLIKTVKSKYWNDMVNDLVNPSKSRSEKRHPSRKDYRIRLNKDQFEIRDNSSKSPITLKAHSLLGRDKLKYTRHQSTTVVYSGPNAQKYFPNYYNQGQDYAVGLVFLKSECLINFITMASNTFFHTHKDHTSYEIAVGVLQMNFFRATLLRTVDELIRFNILHNPKQFNEALAYLKFTENTKIMIFEDTLENRLEAQLRAAHLHWALRQEYPQKSFKKIPIVFYRKTEAAGFPEYSVEEQQHDLQHSTVNMKNAWVLATNYFNETLTTKLFERLLPSSDVAQNIIYRISNGVTTKQFNTAVRKIRRRAEQLSMWIFSSPHHPNTELMEKARLLKAVHSKLPIYQIHRDADIGDRWLPIELCLANPVGIWEIELDTPFEMSLQPIGLYHREALLKIICHIEQQGGMVIVHTSKESLRNPDEFVKCITASNPMFSARLQRRTRELFDLDTEPSQETYLFQAAQGRVSHPSDSPWPLDKKTWPFNPLTFNPIFKNNLLKLYFNNIEPDWDNLTFPKLRSREAFKEDVLLYRHIKNQKFSCPLYSNANARGLKPAMELKDNFALANEIPGENICAHLDTFIISGEDQAKWLRAVKRIKTDLYNKGQASGAFLSGPPGKGKTHLAVAISKDLDNPDVIFVGPHLQKNLEMPGYPTVRSLLADSLQYNRRVWILDEFNTGFGPIGDLFRTLILSIEKNNDVLICTGNIEIEKVLGELFVNSLDLAEKTRILRRTNELFGLQIKAQISWFNTALSQMYHPAIAVSSNEDSPERRTSLKKEIIDKLREEYPSFPRGIRYALERFYPTIKILLDPNTLVDLNVIFEKNFIVAHGEWFLSDLSFYLFTKRSGIELPSENYCAQIINYVSKNYDQQLRFQLAEAFLTEVKNGKMSCIYLSGPGGVGKSHLAFALAKECIKIDFKPIFLKPTELTKPKILEKISDHATQRVVWILDDLNYLGGNGNAYTVLEELLKSLSTQTSQQDKKDALIITSNELSQALLQTGANYARPVPHLVEYFNTLFKDSIIVEQKISNQSTYETQNPNRMFTEGATAITMPSNIINSAP